MKRIIKLSAAVFLAVAVTVISFRLYDNYMFTEQREASSNAKMAYNCLLEWCEDNGTDMSAIADDFCSGKLYDVSSDGEGIAHLLYKDINEGYVYVGVAEKYGGDVLFTQWSRKKTGSAAGQYPDGLSIEEFGRKKITLGEYFCRGM